MRVMCDLTDAAAVKLQSGSVEDVSFVWGYKARLPVIQSEEGLRLQSVLFQGLSQTDRWLQVELDGGKDQETPVNELGSCI